MINAETSGARESFWRPTELVSTLLSRPARDVVWQWVSQKQFLGDDNQPRSLPLDVSAEAGFHSLISQVNPHYSSTVLCNELLRKGIVEQDDSGCLLLRRSAYVPGQSDFTGWPIMRQRAARS